MFIHRQLTYQKKFTSSEKFTNVTSNVSGKTDLKEFQNHVENVKKLQMFKNKDVSEREVNIYNDYKELGSEFWEKYKNVNQDILNIRIKEIESIVNTEQKSIKRYSNIFCLFLLFLETDLRVPDIRLNI